MIVAKRRHEFPLPVAMPERMQSAVFAATHWWGLMHCGWTLLTPGEAALHRDLGGTITLAGGPD